MEFPETLAARPNSNRVVKACGRCRAKKEKCDGIAPQCLRCKRDGSECVYGEIRRRGKAKQPNRVKTLEQRLESMESRLASFVPPSEHVGITATANESPSHEQAAPETGGPGSSLQPLYQAEAAAVSPIMFQDAHPPLPSQLLDLMQLQQLAAEMQEAVSKEPPPRSIYIRLYPKSKALQFVEQYLENINPSFPVLDAPSFLARFQQTYPPNITSDEPAWWACVNAVLAIMSQHKAANDSFQTMSRYAWRFFENAMSVYDEIIRWNQGVLGIQSLLLMALFLKGSTETSTVCMLVSAVTRMLRIVGLDDELSSATNTLEAEQRRRLFWITYILDMDTSMSNGLPVSMSFNPQMALPSSSGPLDVFRGRTELCIIQGQIWNVLSDLPKRLDKTAYAKVARLATQLDSWRLRLPEPIRPVFLEPWREDNLDLPAITLHLEFYKALVMVSRVAQFTQDLDEDFMGGTPDSLCAQACRNTLRLVPNVPVCMLDIWHVLFYQLPAFMELAALVIRKPLDFCPDVPLMEWYIGHLENWRLQNCDVDRISSWCKLFCSSARGIVARATSTSTLQPMTARRIDEPLVTRLQYGKLDMSLLTQGLMGNMPGPNAALRAAFADTASQSYLDLGRAALAPDSLRPETYHNK